MTGTINVIIVDDHEIFRTGLVRTITKYIKDVKIVGEAANGAEFVEMIKTTDADLVLMDIRMPVMGGIEATKAAQLIKPDLKIAALSMFHDDENVQQMLDLGAKGFLIKNITSEELSKAIHLLASGKNFFSDEIWSFFSNRLTSKKKTDESKIKLTRRQVEILQMICEGYDNEDIAKKLYISERTVIGHKSNLLEKADCRSTAALISFSIKNKLVNIKLNP